MALALKGEATVEVAGEKYHLVMDNGAWMAAEAVLDSSFLDITVEIVTAAAQQRHLKLSMGAALLYGATRADHPALDLDACGDLLRGGGMDIMTPLYEAVAGSLKFAEPGSGEAKPAAARAKNRPRGTGKRS
jgi:hypothetical protein